MTSNYTVMAVTLLVWIGLFIYLFVLDRKVKKLEENK
jgi:CcmD family protein